MKDGLYEKVINKELENELLGLDKLIQRTDIDGAESPRVLSKYIVDIIEKGLERIPDKQGDMSSKIELINKIAGVVADHIGEQHNLNEISLDSSTTKSAELLTAVLERENTIYAFNAKSEIVRPETSLSQSSLFTGAVQEPSMFTELKKEISSSDRIDMLVSFIKWSGIRLIIDELKIFTQRGGKLRIITTSYMGATDVKAIEELSKLVNTEVKISYDTKRTRLHAKSYVFYRNTGFTTAYIGSSNLSNVAISSGLEWNIKITAQDQPDVLRKIEATFESYLNSSEFEAYSDAQKNRLEYALKSEKTTGSEESLQYIFEINPYPYQQEILDKLEAEREVRNHFKNLIVAATGTGKTVISALDYKRFVKQNPSKANKLLFVAHREEILRQSINCFRGVLKDQNFGDLFVGREKPDSIDHLFISIQTFNSQELFEKTSPDFYDYIIVDEFHHSSAPTYQKLLTYYNPKILLGLTATPERMDGKNILDYFDNRIAAEIRLPEAIDRKLLCPFQYFGVTDTVDLSDLKWSRKGYQISDLTKVYALDSLVALQRVDMIITSLVKYVADMEDVKAIGFCASIDHAKFMADNFNSRGLTSICLTGDSPAEERRTAKERLQKGEIKYIFVVDIYNEGVDIPEVNTVLFLRPTESLTIFLQQLGRGLRLSDNKECLTVLDYIGQANKKYNFLDKFASLLSDTAYSVEKEIKNGFANLPKGCYIQLERKAQSYILDNIKSSFSAKSSIVSKIATFKEDTELELTLSNFVSYYNLDVRTIYERGSFSRLSVLAGVKYDFTEELEETVTKSLSRIASIDSRRWIEFLLYALPRVDSIFFDNEQELMLQMLQFTIWQRSFEDCGFSSLCDGFIRLKRNTVMFNEILELLRINYEKIDFIDEKLDFGFPCPLDLHCTYTRDQLLVALEFMAPSAMREGVKYLEDKKCDVFLVTLNKSDKDYSPTTMYNDYSINEWLFHWQSQSITPSNSATGKRYINHKEQGSKVLLFVRENKKGLGGTTPYTFLGFADYLKHDGSKPMNITWKLQKRIPAKYLRKTNKLIVG